MTRSTMYDLIQRVRTLTATNVGDYIVGNQSYWTDAQIEAVLDQHRLDFSDDLMTPLREVDSGGTVTYYTYQAHYTDLEPTVGGTAVFYVRDSTGTRAGTANYSADYRAGRITFTASTGGTAYYLTGRSYDIYAAAADIWEMKAAHVAERFDFTADGASFKVSQLVQQYERQAANMRAKSHTGGLVTSTFVRDDVALYGPEGFPNAYMEDRD